uniref:Uncharacterized protein n=1 Tax=Timema shepardi TaxID=629360 RepID=A0A7R9AYB1_TIMSH|nr:unnamed protein product [Timema shepardi]
MPLLHSIHCTILSKYSITVAPETSPKRLKKRVCDDIRLDGLNYVIVKSITQIRCGECHKNTTMKCKKCNVGCHTCFRRKDSFMTDLTVMAVFDKMGEQGQRLDTGEQSSYPDREYYVIAQVNRYPQHSSFDCNNVNNGTAHVRGTNIMACAVQFPAEMSRSCYRCPDTNHGKTLTGEKNNEIYFLSITPRTLATRLPLMMGHELLSPINVKWLLPPEQMQLSTRQVLRKGRDAFRWLNSRSSQQDRCYASGGTLSDG